MLTIREMLPEDAEATGYVHYTSWLESYSGLVDSDFLSRTSPERSREMTLCCWDRTLVAQLDGEIVGFCCYGMNQSGRPEIFGLYLLKKAQGLGIGRNLLDAAVQKLPPEGPVYLWVLEGNSHAIGFYEQYCFRLNGIRQEITLGTPNAELRMILERPEPLEESECLSSHFRSAANWSL